MNKGLEVEGYIHSIETGGIIDGPGLRYVIFLQGCPLRCKYCHNPDTWSIKDGNLISADKLLNDIFKYQNFIKKGGITLSGGEPLMQPDFAAAILTGAKKAGIHTAIDTSGAIPLEKCKSAVDAADLILLDIKSFDENTCVNLTGQSNKNAFKLLEYLKTQNKEVWIRQVIVPGITDDILSLKSLAAKLQNYNSIISTIEIIPFHKMGEYKWEHLGLPYQLSDMKAPAKESIDAIRNIFREAGFHTK